MKARVKATGDIVEATYIHVAGNGVKYYDIDKSGYTMTEDELDFDFSYTPDYWTRLEHQAAIAAMQGILSNHNIYSSVIHTTQVSRVAIDYAQELVEKMKEERK